MQDKIFDKKSLAAGRSETTLPAGKNGLHLADNREVAITQRKILDGLKKPVQQKPVQKENNTGLPDNLKSGIENLSGYSLDDVKVHYNSARPAQLHAHAYAQGSAIHIAPGQEKHLPHEAWHVVQQKQGRVKPTMQMKGNVNVNDDKSLETEADVMGRNAMQFSGNNEVSQLRAHSNGCGCASCSGVQSGSVTKAISTDTTSITVQRCPKCANPDCKKGEKCGMGDDLGGLFPSTISGVDPVKYYNQKEGHGGMARQWEHPLANAAMKKSGLSSFYSSSPVVGMPTSVHRGGIDGMGGGVTSTGSSHTSQGWADEVSSAVKSGGNVAGVRKGLIDDINAYASTNSLKEGHKSTFVQLVRGFVEKGMINDKEGQLLASELLKHIDDMLKIQK